MAKIQREQLKELNTFLQQKGLITYLNKYLRKNNLLFEVESLKLKSLTTEVLEDKDGSKMDTFKIVDDSNMNSFKGIAYKNRKSICGSGYIEIEQCSTNGSCKPVCKPKPKK